LGFSFSNTGSRIDLSALKNEIGKSVCFFSLFRDGGRLSYSIMDVCSHSSRIDTRPLLTIDNRGQLETGIIWGTAGILVASREEYGVNQSVVVHVEVRPWLELYKFLFDEVL